jgi:transcriptional regulator with XRE-family HTH domain
MQNAAMTERQRTGRAVQLARKAIGWSQLELAGKVGVNKETVVRLEAGANVRYQTVVAVFAAMTDADNSAVTSALNEAFPSGSPQLPGVGRLLLESRGGQPQQHRADKDDAYTPRTPPVPMPLTLKKSERTMLDESERTILLGYCLGVMADFPHAFARLKRAIKDATDQLHDTLEEEARTQAREAKMVGKN